MPIQCIQRLIRTCYRAFWHVSWTDLNLVAFTLWEPNWLRASPQLGQDLSHCLSFSTAARIRGSPLVLLWLVSNNLLFSFMDTVELSSLRLSYGNLSRRKYLPFLTLDTFQQFKPFTLWPLVDNPILRWKPLPQEMSMCRTVATAFVWSQDQTLVFSFSSSRESDQLSVVFHFFNGVESFQGTDSNRQQWMMRPVSYPLLHPGECRTIFLLQGGNRTLLDPFCRMRN